MCGIFQCVSAVHSFNGSTHRGEGFFSFFSLSLSLQQRPINNLDDGEFEKFFTISSPLHNLSSYIIHFLSAVGWGRGKRSRSVICLVTCKMEEQGGEQQADNHKTMPLWIHLNR